MKRQAWFVALYAVLILLKFEGAAVSAQQSQPAKNPATPKQTAQQVKANPARSTPVCKDLKLIAGTVDKRFDGESDAALAAIWGGDKLEVADRPDTLWDRLVDCVHETKNTAQKVEALRVLAMWEEIRAENLQKLYNASKPVWSPQCLTWIGSMAS